MMLSTGLPSLDRDLGGGLSHGLHFIVGPTMSHKTRGLHSILAKALWRGLRAILFTEGSAPAMALRLLDENRFLPVSALKRLYIVSTPLTPEPELKHLFTFRVCPFDAIFIDNFRPSDKWAHPWVGWDNLEDQSFEFASLHKVPVVATVQTHRGIQPSLEALPTMRLGRNASTILTPICDDKDQHGFKVLKGRSWVQKPPGIGVYFS